MFCIRVQILTDFSDSSIRYSTIEKKEAAHIGYNRFLFTHSLLAVILCFFQAIRETSVHVYKSAGDIVQDAMDEVIADNDFNLPNPTYVERSVNRFRQTLRPAEPTDLSFDVFIV